MCIYIKDSGPGVDEAKIKNICELFNQSDREKMEQQGCGLGLYIASKFIEINNGKLEFSPRKDEKGLTAKISFKNSKP